MLPPFGPYVYLKTLNDKYTSYAKGAASYSKFDLQKNKKNNNQQLIDPIRAAITELSNIAATQRQLEHQAIENYIKKIDAHLKANDVPQLLRQKLEKQKEAIKNIDYEKYTTSQSDLINAINIIQQDLNSYKKRLDDIRSPSSKTITNSKLLYNIQTRVEDFLMGDKRKKSHMKIKYGLKRDIKLKEKLQKLVESRIKYPQLSQEIVALLFVDFNNWVENTKNISYTKIHPEDLDALFEEYEQGLARGERGGQETHLQHIIKTNGKELLALANDMKKQLHSTYLSPQEYSALRDFANSPDKFRIDKNGQQRKIQETRTIGNQSYTKRQAKNLIETYNANIDSDGENIFAFNFHTATSHGDFFEHLRTIISSGVNVSGNVAADLIIPIGTITATKREQQQQRELMKLSHSLGQILTDDFNERRERTIENFDQQIIYAQKLSGQMQDEVEKTEKRLSKISSEDESFFIAHDSLKLYKSSETKNSTFDSFHGRELNAFSALSKLYASSQLSDSMIASKYLITYLINISDATLVNNKEPLETYLSLFAGLLMFDDIKSLTEINMNNIKNELQTSKLNCLHIYDVDGIYMPISVILYNLIEQLHDGLNIINNANTATATINGDEPEEPEESNLADWQNLANATMSSTTIQINFLSSFTEYISNLFKT